MDKRTVSMLMLIWILGLSLFDIRHRKVPVWAVLTGVVIIMGAGISGCLWEADQYLAFLTGMIPGAVLLLLAAVTKSVGWVDGVVLMLAGSVMGFWRCVLTAAISLITLSAVAMVLLILKRVDKRTRIPYIPFLVIGVVFSG